MPDSKPIVAVVMGSTSDWETMKHAVEVLERFGVPHERHVVSAHRTPEWMAEYATRRRGPRHRGDHRRRRRRGAPAGHGRRPHRAAGAGRAGAERGAARARLAAVDRADARRRAGRHAGHRQGRRDQRRAAGRVDPGQLAARAAREAARVPRRADAEGPSGTAPCRDRPGRGAGRARQRAARAHVHDRRPPHGLPRPHVFARLGYAHRAGGRRRGDGALRRPRRAARVRAPASTWSPSSSRTCRARRRARSSRWSPVRPSPEALHIAQQRAREKQFLADRGFPTVPFAVAATQDELPRALVAHRHAGRSSRRRRSGYDGKGQQMAASADQAERIWTSLGRAGAGGREAHHPAGRALGDCRARARRRRGAVSRSSRTGTAITSST